MAQQSDYATLGDFLEAHSDDGLVPVPDRLKAAPWDLLSQDFQVLVNNLKCDRELTDFGDLLAEFLTPPLNHMALLVLWDAHMRVNNGNVNTIDTTIKNYNARVFTTMNPYQKIEAITTDDVANMMVVVWATPTVKGTEISESHANGIYKAVTRVLNFATKHHFLAKNVAEGIPDELVPHPGRDTSVVIQLTAAETGVLFNAMLNLPPTYANVKNSIFLYIILSQETLRTGDLLSITWPEFVAWDKAGKLDPFVLGLLAKYRKAQLKVLEDAGITNPSNLVFVKRADNDSTIAAVTHRSTFSTWFKKILEANGLPNVTIDSLHNMPEECYEAVREFDVTSTGYPIQGEVEIPAPGSAFGRSGPKRTKEQIAAAKENRLALVANYASNHPELANALTAAAKKDGTKKSSKKSNRNSTSGPKLKNLGTIKQDSILDF